MHVGEAKQKDSAVTNIKKKRKNETQNKPEN